MSYDQMMMEYNSESYKANCAIQRIADGKNAFAAALKHLKNAKKLKAQMAKIKANS